MMYGRTGRAIQKAFVKMEYVRIDAFFLHDAL
jgi:hypothetical protein